VTDDWRERRGGPPIQRRPLPPPGRSEPSQVIRRGPGHRPPLARPPQPPPPAQQRPAPTRPPTPAKPPKPAKPAKPAKPRRKRHWGRWIAVVVVALLLGFVGLGVWVDRSLHRAPVLADYPGRPAAGHGATWLLVGSDSRTDLSPEQQTDLATGGDTGNGRTDTIMLIHVPALTADVRPTLVSIPRDSQVAIPGNGENKINAAFSLGGPQLLVQTVEQVTGIRVDHYAEIGFAGFADVVDAVGGVTMCPAEPINDPLAGIDLAAGCQKLNGRNALGYVRTRATPRADLDRMINQREFLSALLHRAASPAVWLNPFRWLPLKDSVTSAVTVDSGVHVWDLVRLASALHGSPVTTTVPIAGSTVNDLGDVIEWNSGAASRLFSAMSADQPVPADVLQSRPGG
jgi:LCP family protein required for cell wall assembly